ncbi:DNA mismatch repair protein [Terramyces sp. JEL0728]|nr:DNA mismatch repair protein [Terramyces sp. JEL0728]
MTVNRIKKLDKIIHRPFNAIKEMLENSLDAKSTQIQILIKDGGLKLLQITDNGTGILKEDLEIVCERFTTSKLTQIEDLSSIATFGFRGEALASITHVAHLTLTSRTANSQCAWRAFYSDGKLVAKKGTAEPKPCAGNVGTQITVEDLFYNIPTRKKAFKNTTEEYNKIVEVASKYAIHNAKVAISVKKQGASASDLQTNMSASKLDNIKSIYGSALGKELKEFSSMSDEYDFKLNGYISNANYNCKKKELVLFINNRLVESQSMKKGLDSVYAKYLPKGGNWFAYISLVIKSENLDVNVHPTKKEVRFLHEDTIIELILQELDSNLESNDTSRTFYVQKSIDEEFRLTTFSQEKPTKISDTQKTPAYKLVRTDSKTRTLDSFLQFSGEPLLKKTRLDKNTPETEVDPDKTFVETHPSEELDISELIDLEQSQKTSIAPNLQTPQTVIDIENIRNMDNENIRNMDIDVPTIRESPNKALPGPKEKQPLTLFSGESDVVLDLAQTTIPANTQTNLTGKTDSGLEILTSTQTKDADISNSASTKEWIEVHLASIQTLKDEVLSQHNEHYTEVFQDHQFVGYVNSQLALIQYQTNLLMVNYKAVSFDFFYQVVIYGFSNFGRIKFSSGVSISDHLTGTTEENLQAANLLIEKAEMLHEYFSIVISESGMLLAIPVLITGYIPDLHKLPEFIQRLVQVDFETELGCFRGLANLLAWLYQVDNDVESVEHLLSPALRNSKKKDDDEAAILLQQKTQLSKDIKFKYLYLCQRYATSPIQSVIKRIEECISGGTEFNQVSIFDNSNLDIGSNMLRDEGLGPLVNALEKSGLKTLNISFNEIEDRVTGGSLYFAQLCNTAAASKSLAKLNLSGNFIVQSGYQSILEALQTRLQLMSTSGYPGLEIVVPERVKNSTFVEVQRLNSLLSAKGGKKKGGKKKK